jgi:hypothetical protein
MQNKSKACIWKQTFCAGRQSYIGLTREFVWLSTVVQFFLQFVDASLRLTARASVAIQHSMVNVDRAVGAMVVAADGERQSGKKLVNAAQLSQHQRNIERVTEQTQNCLVVVSVLLHYERFCLSNVCLSSLLVVTQTSDMFGRRHNISSALLRVLHSLKDKFNAAYHCMLIAHACYSVH